MKRLERTVEMILMPLDRGLWLCIRVQFSLHAANWQYHKTSKSKKRQNLGFSATRVRKNKSFEAHLIHHRKRQLDRPSRFSRLHGHFQRKNGLDRQTELGLYQ